MFGLRNILLKMDYRRYGSTQYSFMQTCLNIFFPKTILTEPIVLPNHPPINFAYYDTKEALMRLLYCFFDKPYFVKKARVLFNSGGDRVFSPPETGTWWNEAQVDLIHSN